MTTTPWHLDAELSTRYADGQVAGALAASIEQHLLRCFDCRARLVPAVPMPRTDAIWAEVLEQVEAPRRRFLERLLLRAGLDDGTARLVAATPSLRAAWLTAVVLVLTLALLTAHADGHGVALFMTLAPVLPALGVAYTFGRAADPTYEITAAAPYSAVRLLAVRTGFVVASTLLPAAVISLFLPGSTLLAVAWLLPALALTVGTLALSTKVAPHLAAIGLTALWVALVIPGLAQSRDPLLAAAPAVQLASMAALCVSAAALFVERHALPELLRRTR
jgi:hypothetical protein